MAELEIRRFGRTEMRVRALGLGCAPFGEPRHTDQDAIEGIRRAIELGINFLDTSPLYGESERRVGLALEGGYRDAIYLETKIGTHPLRRGDYSAEATKWSVGNSLKLLKTDYLDSVLIHDPSDIEDPLGSGRCLDTLLKMKEEGIIGFVGLGVRSHAFHRRVIETGLADISLTYLDYTLLDQSAAQTVMPLAAKHDVGIILASILGSGGGSLTGREPQGNSTAHAMWEWCRDHGVDVRHLAIQFCLAAPIGGMIMPGPGTKQHVEDCFRLATTELDPGIWRAFKAEFGVGPAAI
jgi:aryl-alcohol dehydrogenase-like predicted oxidoreductase